MLLIEAEPALLPAQHDALPQASVVSTLASLLPHSHGGSLTSNDRFFSNVSERE
jgi:hypothetical protein